MIGIYYLVFFDFCLLLSSLLLFTRVYFYRNIEIDKEKKKKAYSPEASIIPLILLAFASLTFFIGAVLASYGNLAIYLGVRESQDFLKSEANNLVESVQKIDYDLTTASTSINGLKGKTINTLNYTSSTFLPVLNSYATGIKSKVDGFATPVLGYEIGRFSWVWTQIVISMTFAIFALVGYMPCKCCGLVIAASIIVFTIYAEISALLAFSSTELLVVADICEQVYSITHYDRIPFTDSGIAYYLLPISPANIGTTLLHLNKAGTTYDNILALFNQDIQGINNREKKAQCTADVTSLMLNDKYAYVDSLKQKQGILLLLDEAIQYMYDLKSNRHIRKFAYSIQNPLCVDALNKCVYAYFGLGLITIATILVVMISLRLQKFRKIPKLKAATRMIGLYKKIMRFGLKNESPLASPSPLH